MGDAKVSKPDTRSQDAEKPDNDVVGALEQGFRMEFSDLMRVLYGSVEKGGADVQHVVMGSLHTQDRKIYELLGSDEVVRGMAESAVKNIFFELPKDSDRQEIVDEFLTAAKCESPESDYRPFAKDFREKHGDDWDVEPYSDEREYKDPESRTIAFLNDCVAPLMVKAKCGGINAYVTDTTSASSAKLWAHERALERGDEEAAVRLGREFLFLRHNNESLASLIESKAGDDKSFYFGGILRGLRNNDFEEFLKNESGEQRRVIKIDVVPNYRTYAKDFANDWLKNKVQADYVPEFGEDPPDLVYLTEEGMCLTTNNTPQYVLDALKEKGIEYKAVEDLYGQNTADDQSLIAQETEANEGKGLTLGTFA